MELYEEVVCCHFIRIPWEMTSKNDMVSLCMHQNPFPSTPHALCPFLSKVISCMWRITLPHMHKKLASSPYPVLGAFYHLIMLTLCSICHPPEILHGFTPYPKGPFFLDSLRHRELSPCIVKSRSPYVAYTLKPSRWTFSLLASFLLLSMFSLLTSLATRSFSWCPCWRVRLPRVGRSGGLGFWLGFFACRHCPPSIMLSLFLTSFYAHCTGLPWVVSAGVWYAAPRFVSRWGFIQHISRAEHRPCSYGSHESCTTLHPTPFKLFQHGKLIYDCVVSAKYIWDNKV